MAMKYLGETIDIHTGGEDNLFPHHECEVAQSEGATGKQFARYWLHAKFLMVNGEKMSKSKGNFYTLKELLKKGYSTRAIRYIFLSAQYRTGMNFTEEGLKQAEETVSGLLDFVEKIRHVKAKSEYNDRLHVEVLKVRDFFEKYMDDDLNTPQALASIFDFVREVNKAMDSGEASQKNLEEVYEQMMDFDRVLGILKEDRKEKLPAELMDLIMKREEYRRSKNFAAADKVRKELLDKGVLVEDSAEGPKWKRIK